MAESRSTFDTRQRKKHGKVSKKQLDNWWAMAQRGWANKGKGGGNSGTTTTTTTTTGGGGGGTTNKDGSLNKKGVVKVLVGLTIITIGQIGTGHTMRTHVMSIVRRTDLPSEFGYGTYEIDLRELIKGLANGILTFEAFLEAIMQNLSDTPDVVLAEIDQAIQDRDVGRALRLFEMYPAVVVGLAYMADRAWGAMLAAMAKDLPVYGKAVEIAEKKCPKGVKKALEKGITKSI